jgi:hypothetical protein
MDDLLIDDSIYPSVYIAFTSLWAANACGYIEEVDSTRSLDLARPYTTLAFDASEISTLYYLEFPFPDRPQCPEGHTASSKTMTRKMTWSDLTSQCEEVLPGISYHEDYDQNWLFVESQYTSILLLPGY